MPGSVKSAEKLDPKPNNVFYIWYSELCRRLNRIPVAILGATKPKCSTILDLSADRFKFEDWSPLINALRHDTSLHVIRIKSRRTQKKFLFDVNTEEKARRLLRQSGILWTEFMMTTLIKAISSTIKNTQVLTTLELCGLPLFKQYLDILLKALIENKTVKYFSLAYCQIQDTGCSSICLTLQQIPNIESINLSGCDLTSVSGMYIAKLIKFQQLNRYTTSWHESLRYSEPDPERMCGIRRITLNSNPKFGDVGLKYILQELEDDLWIKALDMQKCGITETIAEELINILEYNQIILIADFRQNDKMTPFTLDKIFEILKKRVASLDYTNKFQWCSTERSMVSTAIPSTSRGSIRTTNTNSIIPLRKVSGLIKAGQTNRTESKEKNFESCLCSSTSLASVTTKTTQLNNEIVKNNTCLNGEESTRKPSNKTHLGLNHRLNNVMKTLEKLHIFNDKVHHNNDTLPQKKKRLNIVISKEINGKDEKEKEKKENEIKKVPEISASELFSRYIQARKEKSDSSDENESLADYYKNYDDENEVEIKTSKSYATKTSFINRNHYSNEVK